MTHPDLKTPQETGDMTPKTGDFGSDKNEATRRLNHSSGWARVHGCQLGHWSLTLGSDR